MNYETASVIMSILCTVFAIVLGRGWIKYKIALAALLMRISKKELEPTEKEIRECAKTVIENSFKRKRIKEKDGEKQ